MRRRYHAGFSAASPSGFRRELAEKARSFERLSPTMPTVYEEIDTGGHIRDAFAWRAAEGCAGALLDFPDRGNAREFGCWVPFEEVVADG
jgi:hypothetical protein